MPAQTIKTWIARHISVRTRLEQVCVNYLLFLMVATQKHSFTQAARFSGLNKSTFCKLFNIAPVYIQRMPRSSIMATDMLSGINGPILSWSSMIFSFRFLPSRFIAKHIVESRGLTIRASMIG
jgi:hypothetical protein